METLFIGETDEGNTSKRSLKILHLTRLACGCLHTRLCALSEHGLRHFVPHVPQTSIESRPVKEELQASAKKSGISRATLVRLVKKAKQSQPAVAA